MLERSTIYVDGISLCDEFDMVMETKDLGQPSVKRTVVDIPHGDGQIELTSALSDDLPYSNRTQTFRFTSFASRCEWERVKSRLLWLFEGRKKDYSFSWEQDYTYSGVWSFEFSTESKLVNVVSLTIDADPWKRAKTRCLTVKADGGVVLQLQSGMKPVRPVFTSLHGCIAEANGEQAILPGGTVRPYNIVLHYGGNELYVNTREIITTTWDDIETEERQMTWGEALDKGKRWFEMGHDGASRIEFNGMTWDDLAKVTWADTVDSLTWDATNEGGESASPITITYEWSDL